MIDPSPDDPRGEHASTGANGVLRASVFGVSDGLVSNGALVMGVAAGQGEASSVVLSGIAGLLAGGFSMAAGEYVSMQTQRELFQRELNLEREHLQRYPDRERTELVEQLRKDGADPTLAEALGRAIHRKPESALRIHALIELGINPGELGAPVRAAVFSFLSFVAGAAVPVLPWVFLEGAFLWSALLSAAALLAVGGAATVITRQPVWWGAGRQLVFGLLAASVTFGVGLFLGQAS